MNKLNLPVIFLLASTCCLYGPAALAGPSLGVAAPGPGVQQPGGFAGPNIYGYPGSYYGGAGYPANFGYNTMRPGNMPYVPYGYGAYGAPYGYPAFGVPAPIGGIGSGLYTINGPNGPTYWRSPSGFYYPWVAPSTYVAPIAFQPLQGQAAQATTPPISTVCSDLLQYLDQQKEKGRISESEYVHLKRRATDIRNKDRDLRLAAEGAIDAQDEAIMRKDLDMLGAEVARAVAP